MNPSNLENCDKDVAAMVARYTGAGLGLLAFSITVFAGLAVQNPVTVILSRSILALFLFCVLGMVLGGAAQIVVAERQRRREAEVRRHDAAVRTNMTSAVGDRIVGDGDEADDGIDSSA